MAPATAPKACKRLATVAFASAGEKAYPFHHLRRAVQSIGGNGATDVHLVRRRGIHFHYEATIVACPHSLFEPQCPPDA